MKKFALVFCLIGSFAVAKPAKKSSHREHQAHVHGEAKLMIAFDGSQGKVEFSSPAMSVLGFEHAIKKAQDQKALDQLKTQFETEVAQMIQFDPGLKCEFKKEVLALETQGKHSDFQAQFQVRCASNPTGTVLKIDFTRFSNLDDLDVTVLVGDLQKTAETKKKPLQIDLKP